MMFELIIKLLDMRKGRLIYFEFLNKKKCAKSPKRSTGNKNNLYQNPDIAS